MALLPSKFDEMINKSLLTQGYSQEEVAFNWKQAMRTRGRHAERQSGQHVSAANARLKIRARNLPAEGGLEGMGTVGEAEQAMLKRHGLFRIGSEFRAKRVSPDIEPLMGMLNPNTTSAAEQGLRRGRGLTPEHFTTPGLFREGHFSDVKVSPKAQSIIDAMELNWGAYPPYLPEHKDISKWKDLPPALGLRRGGPVYAEDGIALSPETLKLMSENPDDKTIPFRALADVASWGFDKFVDAGPLGDPVVPYDDPLAPKKTRVRVANMTPRSIAAALMSGNATEQQYKEAWRLARSRNPEDSPRAFLEGLHTYDMAKQVHTGKGRVLESAHLGIDPMNPSTHRRLWDHKGNRLMEGIDPQTGLLKGDVWLRIEARRKAVESQSLIQDYMPEHMAMALEKLTSIHPLVPDWKKDFPSHVENIPYTVAGQKKFEHMMSPGSMNKFGKGPRGSWRIPALRA